MTFYFKWGGPISAQNVAAYEERPYLSGYKIGREPGRGLTVSGPHDLKLEKLPLLLVWPLTAAFLHAGT